jgi:hypothetical protein
MLGPRVCGSLEVLTIHHVNQVDLDVLTGMVAAGGLPALTWLEIWQIDREANVGPVLAALAQRTPGLQLLVLDGAELSPADARHIATFADLEQLHLYSLRRGEGGGFWDALVQTVFERGHG